MVVTVGGRHHALLRVQPHTHLAQVVGEDGGQTPEGGLVLQTVVMAGGGKQRAALVHPVVAVGVVAVEQRAAQAGQQAGHVQPVRVVRRLGLQEPAAHAGQALHQQRFNARILDH